MEVISPRSISTLNPNAPVFIPLSYQTVEDFSDQWWNLIHTSPCFHNYWLRDRERFTDESDLFLPDDLEIDEFDSFNFTPKGEEKETNFRKELVTVEAMKWRKGKTVSESSRKMEKTPKIVNLKVSPRPIQQPR